MDPAGAEYEELHRFIPRFSVLDGSRGMNRCTFTVYSTRIER